MWAPGDCVDKGLGEQAAVNLVAPPPRLPVAPRSLGARARHRLAGLVRGLRARLERRWRWVVAVGGGYGGGGVGCGGDGTAAGGEEGGGDNDLFHR